MTPEEVPHDLVMVAMKAFGLIRPEGAREALAAVLPMYAHLLAEQQRALPLSGAEAGVRDALANHIDPLVPDATA